jgi:hypothetical protein
MTRQEQPRDLDTDIRIVEESLAFRSDVPWPSLQRVLDALAALRTELDEVHGQKNDVTVLLDKTRAALRARTTPDRDALVSAGRRLPFEDIYRMLDDYGETVTGEWIGHRIADRIERDAVLALFADPAPAPAAEADYVYGVRGGFGMPGVFRFSSEVSARAESGAADVIVRSADGGATWEPAP